MRRGIVRLEEALAMAETLRRERLHGPDDVFVLREPDGVRVDGAAPSPAEANGATESAGAPPPTEAAKRNGVGTPPAPRTVDLTPPGALWHLISGIERARRASARAVEIHARFDRSTAALEAALRRGGAAPPRLVQQQARTQALRALIASAAESFDRVTALAEARLHGTWMDAANGARSRPPPASPA